MKKRNIMLTALALVFGVAIAFANMPAHKTVKELTTQWYEYKGSGDIHDPANYMPIASPSCDGAGDLCAVLVNLDENGAPDFSAFVDSRNKE